MRNLRTYLFLLAVFNILSPVGYCQQEAQNTFLILTIDDKIISPVVADYLCAGIDEAQNNNDQGVIIQIDTPGGLLESTRTIVKKILNADIPVIVYISPGGSRAGSAGVFIAMAAHIAAMAPSTNIGAAHPVEIGLQKKGDRSLKEAIKDLIKALKTQKADVKKKIKEKDQLREEEKKRSENPMKDKVLNDTLAGVISMLIGSLMLIRTPFSMMKVSLNIILPLVLGIASLVIFLTTNVVKTHKKRVTTGPESLTGQTGTARQDIPINEEGQVFVSGEIWTAVNRSKEPIKIGEKIKVLGVDKIKLLVSKYVT